MGDFDEELVTRLRALAIKGAKPSEMLRELRLALGPIEGHKLALIKYARKAFNLSLQQASPIAGWAAEGTGELSDSRLDELLAPEIGEYQSINGETKAGQDMRAS
jgi:hypothetical protein